MKLQEHPSSYDPQNHSGNGRKCKEPVGLINVYKTLSDLVGLDAPDYIDGKSLKPWLRNPSKAIEQPAMTTWGRGNYTLRSKKWRYTRYFDGSEELYLQTKDPNEWYNLAGNDDYQSIKSSFRKWLPKKEAPQIVSGRELYNVVDADNPTKNIKSYERYVNQFKKEGLYPPLD